MIQEVPEALENEDLIEMLNAGLIPLVVVDSHVAARLEVHVLDGMESGPDRADVLSSIVRAASASGSVRWRSGGGEAAGSEGGRLHERILIAHAGADGVAALDRLEARCRAAGCAEASVLELRLVAEEVLTNIAKYGFEPGATPTVELRVSFTDADAILEFRDEGRAFDPLAELPPDRGAPRGERALGGLGLTLLRALVEEARYVREGSTNVLRLVKRRAAH